VTRSRGGQIFTGIEEELIFAGREENCVVTGLNYTGTLPGAWEALP